MRLRLTVTLTKPSYVPQDALRLYQGQRDTVSETEADCHLDQAELQRLQSLIKIDKIRYVLLPSSKYKEFVVLWR